MIEANDPEAPNDRDVGDQPLVTSRVCESEVVELLRCVGNGDIKPQLGDKARPWNESDCVDVEFLVDGWLVVVFCDFGWDYVDNVVSPDGRTGEYDDWFGPAIDCVHRESRQPDDTLSRDDPDCYDRMVKAFASSS